MQNKTEFTPNLTMLYRDSLLTRARLKALTAIVEFKLPNIEKAAWKRLLGQQTEVEIKSMIQHEAKKDKRWAALLSTGAHWEYNLLPLKDRSQEDDRN